MNSVAYTSILTRRTFLAVVAVVGSYTCALAPAEAAGGSEIFNKVCIACHTVGAGKRVGPDLKGVTERRSEEWLIKFIRSSQALVKSGDSVAVALFNEFNKVPMPDQAYSTEEIKDILAFIKTGGGGAAGPAMREATPTDIEKGQELFQGLRPFAKGGPACNSCHHVRNDAVIGGGILARELTTVFGRMGAPGVQAILGKPPFPVMDQAYKDRPLTDDEVVAMVGFLKKSDQQHAYQQPRDYGFKLFYSGVAGLAILMALYALIWRRRKTHPVNHRIFERQVKSE